ncbi:MAG: hypothetical protein ACT4OI_07790 [Methanobacteriota archaeon]
MALGLFWQLNVVVAVVGLGFLAGLVYVYARNLRHLRSPFTLGLLAFGALFVLQNLLAIYFYVAMADQGLGANVAVPMLALNVAGVVGFASLFAVTWR